MDLSALLKGQRVLGTGASSGLGTHFARLAARCGARVVIAARRKDKLDALGAELAALGSPPAVARESSSRHAARTTSTRWALSWPRLALRR